MLAEDRVVDDKVAELGAGLAGSFFDTSELQVMKYKEAMQVDREGWIKAVCEEHNRMIANNVRKPVKKSEVPRGAKILTLTWA